MEKKLKVINLFGSPATGKSATRGGLFWLMKILNVSVEEVSEYAKYLVLSNRQWQLKKDQLYVIAKQHHKMLVLENDYDFAITDSPLLLASYYAPEDTPKTFHPMCLEYFNRYDNLNIFLHRDLNKHFEKSGRIHDLSESLIIEKEQQEFLVDHKIDFTNILLNHQTPWDILKIINKKWPGYIPENGPLPPESFGKII